MAYESKHVSIKTAKDGYNSVAKEYQRYHQLLDSFDQGMFKRFLPRNGKILNIIDLGAGDGRMYKHLQALPHKRYVACDIADQLLKRHPWTSKIEKVVCNVAEPLPFENNSFDLATSFFLFEHLEQLEWLFSEVERILAPKGRWLIGHFLQRREFLWKIDSNPFKIEFYNHRIENIEALAKQYFSTVDVFPVKEKADTIGYIILIEK